MKTQTTTTKGSVVPTEAEIAAREAADKAAADKAASDLAAAQAAEADALARSEEQAALIGGDGKDWSSVLIVVRGDVPTNARRPVIYVQNSEREAADSAPEGEAPYGTHRNANMAPIKAVDYPEGADVYFAIDGDVDFGPGRNRIGVAVGGGSNVEQAGFEGFTHKLGHVHVGPGSPIYAAANYAYTRGAKKIEIVGMTPEEVEQLRPWFTFTANKLGDQLDLVYGG